MMNTKSPHWILQQNLTNAQVLATIKTILEEDDVTYEEVFVIPFSEEVPEIQHPARKLIFYGSSTLMLNAYNDLRYRKGVFYDPATFCFSNYLCQWGTRMLNHEGRITRFADLACEDNADDAVFFIRPNGDTKAFAGQLMQLMEIKAMAVNLQDSQHPHLDLQTEIVVSKPKVIEKEWRSFIVDGKIISTSRYLQHGDLSIDPQDVPVELIAFIEAAVAIDQPHPIFVLDTAYCEGHYAILECNCFNGTGFYGHNIPKIVRAVNDWVGIS